MRHPCRASLALLLILAPLGIGAQATPSRNTLEGVLLGLLTTRDHWMVKAGIKPRFTWDEASATGQGTQVILTWAGLPGGGSLSEAWDLELVPESGNISRATLAGSAATVALGPTKMTAMLPVFHALRNRGTISTLLPLAPRIVAFHRVDAYAQGPGPFGEPSIIPVVLASGVTFQYHYPVAVLLDFDYLSPRGRTGYFEVFRRQGLFRLWYVRANNGPWSLAPEPWDLEISTMAERSRSLAPLPPRAPQVFHNLVDQGFDAIWGSQEAYRRGMSQAGSE